MTIAEKVAAKTATAGRIQQRKLYQMEPQQKKLHQKEPHQKKKKQKTRMRQRKA